MKLVTILNKANEAYPDGFLSEYFDESTGVPTEGSGDGLAKFIVDEIRETYDDSASDKDQIQEAFRVIIRGVANLEAVCLALHRMRIWDGV